MSPAISPERSESGLALGVARPRNTCTEPSVLLSAPPGAPAAKSLNPSPSMSPIPATAMPISSEAGVPLIASAGLGGRAGAPADGDPRRADQGLVATAPVHVAGARDRGAEEVAESRARPGPVGRRVRHRAPEVEVGLSGPDRDVGVERRADDQVRERSAPGAAGARDRGPEFVAREFAVECGDGRTRHTRAAQVNQHLPRLGVRAWRADREVGMPVAVPVAEPRDRGAEPAARERTGNAGRGPGPERGGAEDDEAR